MLTGIPISLFMRALVQPERGLHRPSQLLFVTCLYSIYGKNNTIFVNMFTSALAILNNSMTPVQTEGGLLMTRNRYSSQRE